MYCFIRQSVMDEVKQLFLSTGIFLIEWIFTRSYGHYNAVSFLMLSFNFL